MKIGEVIENFPCIDEFVKNKEVDLLLRKIQHFKGLSSCRNMDQLDRLHAHTMAIIFIWDGKIS